MSVVTHVQQGYGKDHSPIEVFVKGAPEMVASLSKPETGMLTINDNKQSSSKESLRNLSEWLRI